MMKSNSISFLVAGIPNKISVCLPLADFCNQLKQIQLFLDQMIICIGKITIVNS